VGRDGNGHGQRQGRPLTEHVADELDSLFAAAPAKFIEERKRIVAALKAAGRKDEAKAVEKIPRPSVPVWVVNQIARRDPETVRRLGAITERLQSAAGAEYGAAATEHRQVLGVLRDQANEILTEAGHEAGAQIVQRVVANLRAAAGNAETRATLEHGRLERDLEEQEAASLFGLAGAAAIEAPTPAKPAAGAKSKAAEKTADAKAEKAEKAEKQEAKAEEKARAKAIAGAEREAKRLRDEAEAARKDVARAERAVAAAQEALGAAEKKLAAERDAADAAADALSAAEAELVRLSKA
jgi:hypothetical protein